MTEKKTRAEVMTEQILQKLADLEPKKPSVRKHVASDKQTPEQKERLEKAKAKLRDFIDLIK